MYFPPKSFITKVLEAVIAFVVAVWLIKLGICMLQEIWGWVILIGVVIAGVIIGWRIHKHHKDTRGF